jgi:hypothetical protein
MEGKAASAARWRSVWEDGSGGGAGGEGRGGLEGRIMAVVVVVMVMVMMTKVGKMSGGELIAVEFSRPL